MITTRTGLGTSSGSDVRSREVRVLSWNGNRGVCRFFDDEETVGSFGPGASRPWNFEVDRGKLLGGAVGTREELPWELSNGWSQGSGLELERRCHKETTAGKNKNKR